jgi:integrase/recombinase XerD
VPIAPPLVPILDEYVRTLRPGVPKSAFFVNPSSQSGGTNTRRYARCRYRYWSRLPHQGGVSRRYFPHRWRHSNGTSLLRRGADIHVVQRLLGHANIATTTRYLYLCDADLTDAVDKAFPAE